MQKYAKIAVHNSRCAPSKQKIKEPEIPHVPKEKTETKNRKAGKLRYTVRKCKKNVRRVYRI